MTRTCKKGGNSDLETEDRYPRPPMKLGWTASNNFFVNGFSFATSAQRWDCIAFWLFCITNDVANCIALIFNTKMEKGGNKPYLSGNVVVVLEVVVVVEVVVVKGLLLGQHTSGRFLVNPQTDCLKKVMTAGFKGLLVNNCKRVGHWSK